jgi:uncharacterized protein (DUF488 family)
MIYTIGHSNHPIERFLELLKAHAIGAVADVRSTPYSRFNPQFNREVLKNALTAAAVEYVFLGEELGARAKDPECYDGDRVSYDKLAATETFRRGIERLMSGMREYRIALMCAEREPLECHRTILVARALARLRVPVSHILVDGSLEDHRHAMERLAATLKLAPSGDLFGDSDDERIELAYERQGVRIAYTRSAR